MTALCACWSAVLSFTQSDALIQNLRVWEGHDRPHCMCCTPPSSSTEEEDALKSAEVSSSASSLASSAAQQPASNLVCMSCGLVCCMRHAEQHARGELLDEVIEVRGHCCFYAPRSAVGGGPAGHCVSCRAWFDGVTVHAACPLHLRCFLDQLDALRWVRLDSNHPFFELSSPRDNERCRTVTATLLCIRASQRLATYLLSLPDCSSTTASPVTHALAAVLSAQPTAGGGGYCALVDRLHALLQERAGTLVDVNAIECSECFLLLYKCIVSEQGDLIARGGGASPIEDVAVVVELPLEDLPASSASTTVEDLLASRKLSGTLLNGGSKGVIALRMQRFVRIGDDGWVKDNRSVSFPERMSLQSVHKATEPVLATVSPTAAVRAGFYELVAVLAHRGERHDGRNVALVRDPRLPHRWFCSTDANPVVHAFSLVAKEASPCMLLYELTSSGLQCEALHEVALPPPH